MKEIIGVSGTNGAGKDTFSNYVIQRTGGMQIGLGSVLRDQLSPGIIPTRENLAQLSARLREEYGLAVLVDFAISKFRTSDNKNLIVNGIRHPAEAKKIKEVGGLMLWIDAPISLRYQRITENDRNRIEDRVSFADFQLQEQREMTSSSELSVNLTAVRRLADLTLVNSYKIQREFEAKIDELLFHDE